MNLLSTISQPRSIRPGLPRIRTTYQIAADLMGRDGAQNILETAREVVLDWIAEKLPRALPSEASLGEACELDLPGQKLLVVAIPNEGVWSLRLEQPDAPFRDRPAVPGRVWTTEIALREDEPRVRVGVRVQCSSLPYSANAPVELTRPRVVRDLSQRMHLSQGRLLNGKPWEIVDDDDVRSLYAFLQNPVRALPVFVLTEPNHQEYPGIRHPFVLDAELLARDTIGLAHVVKLPWEPAYAWTQIVGKPWSVFNGAVRTYQPSLHFDDDESRFEHPRAMVDRILFFSYREKRGEDAFAAFLVDQAKQSAATAQIGDPTLLFYDDAKARSARAKRSSGSESDDWRLLYEEEIAALREQVEKQKSEINGFVELADQASRERDLLDEENRKLRFRIDDLADALKRKTGNSVDNQTPIGDSYEDLPDWVDKYLAGRVELHPRAIRALKNARFRDVHLVYKSLLILASEYRDMQIGVENANGRFEAACNDLGVRYDGSISRTRAGEQGDEYFVNYPLHSGQKRFVDKHLRKGTTKDDQHCMAIYFFWDDDTRQIIVGSLPAHLDNRQT